jgi:hypothetical protein
VPRVRPGCGCGCLTVVLVSLLVLGAVWYGRGIFAHPAGSYEIGSPADGRRAQQKLFELAGRVASARRDQKRITVTISEREINAFLARHVSDQLPLAEGAVRFLGNGIVEITGRLPLRAVFGDSIRGVATTFPEQWATQSVWLRLRGPLRLETGSGRADRRRLRLEVESFWVGRCRLPALVWTLLPEGPLLRATRWPISETIDSVVVEPGRLIVTGRS